MIIFSQSFISIHYKDGPSNSYGPERVRQDAVMFANKVNETGDVISVSETSTKWGDSVTVWYKSMNRMEIN